MLLISYFRPKAYLMVEQPISSWLFKQRNFMELIFRCSMQKVLTYQGFFGGSLLKGTHLMTTLPTLWAVSRRATWRMKEKFKKEVAKRNRKLRQQGKPVPVFYVKSAGGGFHGTKDLTSTATYPSRFVRAIFQCWQNQYNSVYQ